MINDILNIKFKWHFLVFTSFELAVALETISLNYLTLNSLGSPHPALICCVACDILIWLSHRLLTGQKWTYHCFL